MLNSNDGGAGGKTVPGLKEGEIAEYSGADMAERLLQRTKEAEAAEKQSREIERQEFAAMARAATAGEGHGIDSPHATGFHATRTDRERDDAMRRSHDAFSGGDNRSRIDVLNGTPEDELNLSTEQYGIPGRSPGLPLPGHGHGGYSDEENLSDLGGMDDFDRQGLLAAAEQVAGESSTRSNLGKLFDEVNAGQNAGFHNDFNDAIPMPPVGSNDSFENPMNFGAGDESASSSMKKAASRKKSSKNRSRGASHRYDDDHLPYAHTQDDADFVFGKKSSPVDRSAELFGITAEEEAEARGRVASAHEMIDTISPQLEAVAPSENYLLKYTTPALSNTLGGSYGKKIINDESNGNNSNDRLHTGNNGNASGSGTSGGSGTRGSALRELMERDRDILEKAPKLSQERDRRDKREYLNRTPTFNSDDIDPSQSLAAESNIGFGGYESSQHSQSNHNSQNMNSGKTGLVNLNVNINKSLVSNGSTTDAFIRQQKQADEANKNMLAINMRLQEGLARERSTGNVDVDDVDGDKHFDDVGNVAYDDVIDEDKFDPSLS